MVYIVLKQTVEIFENVVDILGVFNNRVDALKVATGELSKIEQMFELAENYNYKTYSDFNNSVNTIKDPDNNVSYIIKIIEHELC